MTQEELNAMVDAEAQRLGIGSSAFMERHREIMELTDGVNACKALVQHKD